MEQIKVNPKPETELKVATLYGSQIYIETEQGSAGFDYEFAKGFAEHLGRELVMLPYTNIDDLYQALESGKVDMIAAGLAATKTTKERFRISPPLYHVDQHIVYKQGTSRPKNVQEISGDITVIASSPFVDALEKLREKHSELKWRQKRDMDSEELLSMIDNEELNYTISDSTTFQINRRFLPELRAGPVIAVQQPIVWLLSAHNSDQLMSELLAYWHKQQQQGTLAHLQEKYFAHVKRFDYVDTRIFMRAIDERLPKYKDQFILHAGELDWRKLAAIAYQESHWKPNAVSPTGVKGLMMLTLPTAKQMGVENRLDPVQSITGGAKYLNNLLERLPASIPKNQRVWFALASYNVGFGHVEDARRLAQSMGLNPSAWRDIKEVLPLLQKRKYYKKTRYGYARGNEAVHYVENIRRYYDTLVWIDNQNNLIDAERNNNNQLVEKRATSSSKPVHTAPE